MEYNENELFSTYPVFLHCALSNFITTQTESFPNDKFNFKTLREDRRTLTGD